MAEARQDWNVGTAILPGKGWLITPWAPGDPVPEGARVIPGPVVICDA